MDNKDLTAVKNAASKKTKVSKIIIYFAIIDFVAFTITFFVFNGRLFKLMWYISIIGIIVLMTMYTNAESEYLKAVTNNIINPVIQERFPNIKYSPDVSGSLRNTILEKYKNAKMYNSDSSIVMQNYITSDVNNLEIVSLKTYHTEKDSDNGSSIVTSFEGTLVSFDTEVNVPDDCVVKVTCSTQGLFKEKTFVPFTYDGSYKNQKTIDVGNTDFDECFQVCADSEHNAMYVLNPYVVEKLMNLRQLYNEYSIYISKHRVLVSLNEHDAFISIPSSDTKFDETIFDKFGERLQYMIDFLNDVVYSISSGTKVNNIF